MAEGLEDRYDATNVGFLPVIFGVRAWILAAALGVGGVSQHPVDQSVADAHVQATAPTGRVVAGGGAPRATALAEVEALVATQTVEVHGLFAGLQIRPFLVAVHESRANMPEHLQRFLHPGCAAFTLLGQRQIHLVWGEMARSGTSLRAIVTHELVHELLDQWAAPRAALMPRWFHEGLAQVVSGETYLGAREQDLVWRVGTDRLLPFADLRDGFPLDPERLQLAYAQSHSYVAWLVGRFGLAGLLAIAANVDRQTTFERALSGGTGWTSLQLVDGWVDHLRNGSGAWSRIALEQSFHVLLLAAVPLLWLALRRRNARELRAAGRLDQLARWQIEAAARARAAAQAAALDPFAGGTLAGGLPGRREGDAAVDPSGPVDPAADVDSAEDAEDVEDAAAAAAEAAAADRPDEEPPPTGDRHWPSPRR